MRVKSLILASSAAAALAMSAGAASAEPDGWYGAVDAGYHIIDDINTQSSVTGHHWKWDVNDGWTAFARLGYRFNSNWRAELEGGYRSGDIGTIRAVSGPQGVCNTSTAPACHSPNGDVTSTTLMANVLYDFGTSEWTLRPFVGLGVGVNRVSVDTVGRLRQLPGGTFAADDSSTRFAAQGIAGLAWAVSDRANVDLTYRYLTGDMEFDGLPAATFGTLSADYDQSHAVTLGLRYAFGAEETPPPPPPAPVARQFVVYFDFDKSNLTPEAASVVSQASNYAKSGAPTRILVVGHTDTSGNAAYNLGLSNRRARTVADALVAQGVNGGVISLEGVGEANLAVPTADGVREPLNRRATVNINF